MAAKSSDVRTFATASARATASTTLSEPAASTAFTTSYKAQPLPQVKLQALPEKIGHRGIKISLRREFPFRLVSLVCMAGSAEQGRERNRKLVPGDNLHNPIRQAA